VLSLDPDQPRVGALTRGSPRASVSRTREMTKRANSCGVDARARSHSRSWCHDSPPKDDTRQPALHRQVSAAEVRCSGRRREHDCSALDQFTVKVPIARRRGRSFLRRRNIGTRRSHRATGPQQGWNASCVSTELALIRTDSSSPHTASDISDSSVSTQCLISMCLP